jgi:tetratricopeptide (TPR) repeat protein
MKLIYCCIALLLTFCSVQAQTSEEFCKMAQQKFDQEKYQDANTLIEKAREKDKTNYKNYILKARIDYHLNNYVQAVENSHKAIAAAPDKSEPYMVAGALYNSYFLPDSAIAMFNRAYARAESDSIKYECIIFRSSAYRNKRDFKSAKKDLELVLAADPNHLHALNNIAIIYANMNKPEKAIVYLEQVARQDSTSWYPFLNLGLYHTQTGNYEAAMANFNIAVLLAPEHPLIYSNRGHLFYKTGDYTRAIKDLNRSLNEYPTNSYAYRNRALVYMAMNKKEEACRDLDAALVNGFTELYGTEVKKLAKKNCK